MKILSLFSLYLVLCGYHLLVYTKILEKLTQGSYEHYKFSYDYRIISKIRNNDIGTRIFISVWNRNRKNYENHILFSNVFGLSRIHKYLTEEICSKW